LRCVLLATFSQQLERIEKRIGNVCATDCPTDDDLIAISVALPFDDPAQRVVGFLGGFVADATGLCASDINKTASEREP
jgi:hypothetical protein